MIEKELEELISDCPTLYHMAERGSWASIMKVFYHGNNSPSENKSSNSLLLKTLYNTDVFSPPNLNTGVVFRQIGSKKVVAYHLTKHNQ